jgi:hypothetical protein
MSLTIKNTVSLMWKVEDPVYSYQGSYQYTKEEFAALDWDAVAEQQTQEYNEWFAMIKASETPAGE